MFPEAGLTGVHIPTERDRAKEFLVKIPSPESATRPCSDSTCDKVNILSLLYFTVKAI